MELEGRLYQGKSLADSPKTHLEAQKEMTTQWRELYQSTAPKGSLTQS